MGGLKRGAPLLDPFQPLFDAILFCQEKDVPLLFGVVLAMIMANTTTGTYNYYFGANCPEVEHGRRLAGGADVCICPQDQMQGPCDRFMFIPCVLFGHTMTIHFIANDIIMAFFFGLATKEVTEALLPGGSLNPPVKAINPLVTTIGGVGGPVALYFIFLEVFLELGWFDEELAMGITKSELGRGWGVVTATDIVLAWLIGRIVFGDGHPAIDYLLLLAVADDLAGIVIIAIFYPDPNNPVKPMWMLLVAFAMFLSYLFRKWHYRMPRRENQPWQPYIVIAGTISWVGFIKAHLHPALSLVPIVPFMPGPEEHVLEGHGLGNMVKNELDAVLKGLGLYDVITSMLYGELERTSNQSDSRREPVRRLSKILKGMPGSPSGSPQKSSPGKSSFDRTPPTLDLGKAAMPTGVEEEKTTEAALVSPTPTNAAELEVIVTDANTAANGASAGPSPPTSEGKPKLRRNSISHGNLPHMPSLPSKQSMLEAKEMVVKLRNRVLPRNVRQRKAKKQKDAADKRASFNMAPGETAPSAPKTPGAIAADEIVGFSMGHEDDDEHKLDVHDSTLCEFEHFWKPYVDFGLAIFSLVNAGVKVNGVGAMTLLIFGSLVLGKVLGVIVMFHFCVKVLGYPAPLGVRAQDVHMIGLMAALGLTVALFVSEVAFENPKLKGDCKIGALLSALVLGMCYVISMFHDYHVDTDQVGAVARKQIMDELNTTENRRRVNSVSGYQGDTGESFDGMPRSKSAADVSPGGGGGEGENELTRRDMLSDRQKQKEGRLQNISIANSVQ